MNLNEFVNKIEENDDFEKESFHGELVNFLIEKYKKINKSIDILQLEVTNSNHFLILKFENWFYFELDFNKTNIHVIINSYEEMYFFDDNYFLRNYNKILNDLFNGRYTIVEFNSFYSELYFIDDTEKMNNDIKNKEKKTYELVQGVKLINS